MKVLIKFGGELVAVLANPSKEHLEKIKVGLKSVWPGEVIIVKTIKEKGD